MSKRRNSAGSQSLKAAALLRAGQSRWLTASLIGCGAGLLIVGIAAWLTPLSDDMPEAGSEAAAANATANANASSESVKIAVAAPPAASAPRAVLALPHEPELVQVASLQEELRVLADRLPIEYSEDVASFHFAAQAYSELKQSDKAEGLWRQCLALSPKHMGPYVGFASMLMEKGRNEEAVAVLRQAQQLGGSAPELLEKLGEAYENLGELPKALECLTAATSEYPTVAELWLLLGRVQNQLGQASQAETSLRKSMALGGNRTVAMIALNAALVRQGKTAEAAANRDELARVKESQAVDADSFQDRYDFALSRIASDIFVSAGTLAETHDKLEEAEGLYLRGAALNPRNSEAYRGLLGVCRRQQRWVDQKVLLNKLIELSPQDLIAYTNLASVSLQMGDPALAELTLKKAIALDPEGVLAQAALVKLYLATGNLDDARLLAARVVERQPNSATYRLLAATYQASGFEDAFTAANQKADELAEAGTNAPNAN